MAIVDTSLGEQNEPLFVGRQEALDAFYQCFAYRHFKNAIYYPAEGGIGKTKLLRKIFLEHQADPIITTTEIIDFYNIQNQHIHGLQSSIRTRIAPFCKPDAFDTYDKLIQQIETNVQSNNPSQLSIPGHLENRANKLFIDCCRRAILNRDMVLIFDTLERVQTRDVGHWFLQEFLPAVRGIIMVIAGRPEPQLPNLPANVTNFPLTGLHEEDVMDYAALSLQLRVSEPLLKSIWLTTQGNPLLISLLFNHTSPEYVDQLVKDNPAAAQRQYETLKRDLIEPFATPTIENRVVWAMAILKRRFDVAIFEAIVKPYLGNITNDCSEMLRNLQRFKFIKEYPEQESHLLHDEMQKMVTEYLLEDIDPQYEIRNQLYQLVAVDYYDVQIKHHFVSDHPLAMQLRAEQFGYLLDHAVWNHDFGSATTRYRSYIEEIEQNHDYDFEELLWGEFRYYLSHLPDQGFEISNVRARLLRRNNLFAKAELHYLEMLEKYPEAEVELRKALGFCRLRQGKAEEAIVDFELGQQLAGSEDDRQQADFENLLGQAKRANGKWDEAIKHYFRASEFSISQDDQLNVARIYSNRGYLYSLLGARAEAINDCKDSITLLEGLTNSSRERLFAFMNLGTAYRHSGDYASAQATYKDALQIATDAGDHDGECNCLQNLGINYSLIGRESRQNDAFTEAANYQLQALQNLVEALGIAKIANWQISLAEGYSRLAKVYDEINRLENQVDSSSTEFTTAFKELRTMAAGFEPDDVENYRSDLLLSDPFAEQTWLEKSATLFDLSALIAEETNDIHRALDSLMNLGRVLLELGRYSDIYTVVSKTDLLKGSDLQADLFSAIGDITLADLDYANQRYEAALKGYATAYPILAKQRGYATYLLKDHLREFERRLRSLEPTIQLQWCKTLGRAWVDSPVASARPEMLKLLEKIQQEAIKSYKTLTGA